MPNASWTWGVRVVYDTTTEKQAIVWIQSQYLVGVCSEGALRKILVTMCNMFVF